MNTAPKFSVLTYLFIGRIRHVCTPSIYSFDWEDLSKRTDFSLLWKRRQHLLLNVKNNGKTKALSERVVRYTVGHILGYTVGYI